MPMKHYGIYVAYPPSVDLRDQGLGRHLAMFLKGAENLPDVKFIIICPSWTKQTLENLFKSEQVSSEIFNIITPKSKPYALKLFEAFQKFRKRPKYISWVSKIRGKFARNISNYWSRLIDRATAAHTPIGLIALLTEAFILLIFLTPLILITFPAWVVFLAIRLMTRHPTDFLKKKSSAALKKSSAILIDPRQTGLLLSLFENMHKQETIRMQAKISGLKHISAWYCPTAFWPSFHDIQAPRLMCLPDVVLSDFPVGFSTVGGDRFLNTFETIQCSIRKSENFTTYSETVKWGTLVDRYGVPATNITVIPHAPNSLSQYVTISGFPDTDATSRHYCQTLLQSAFRRSTNQEYTNTFQNYNVKFLFYASQLRPNKNVLMLLRAFEYLLRQRYLGHKLILTGNPNTMPEISNFVVKHRLEKDVIFLHGLSISELAACYKLADLAVNPSLSEGGCPFTFTEALSVDTPVVMSRIPVTEEILTDQRLQDVTFFDPYNWQDCAKRIEWAIKHRDELLMIQRETYTSLNQRTWSDVVSEHIKAMDRIAEQYSETKQQ